MWAGMSNHAHHSTPRLFFTALPLVLAAGSFIGACGGGDGSTSSGTGGSGGSTTASTTTGTTTTSSTTGATTGTGGAAMNPDPCDPFAQDCVEAVDSKCTIHLDADSMISGTCEAPLGDQKLGEICERPTDEPGVDTCEKGLYCAFFGHPKTTPQERSCLALCEEVGACAAGTECATFSADTSVGICAPTCVPFDPSSCGGVAGVKCSILGLLDGNGGLLCDFEGTKKAYEVCTYGSDCGKDTVCRTAGGPFVCSPFCDDTHLCGDATAHCKSFASPLLEAYGSCFLSDYTCLGAVTWDSPMNAKESVQVVAFDAFTGDVVSGAQVKACAAADAACAAPLAQGATGADGAVFLDVPTAGAGFDGYIEVTAAGMLPLLAYRNRPVAGPNDVLAAPLTSLANVEVAIKGAATANLARGLLFGLAIDCSLAESAGGTSFAISTADASTIVAHGLPSAERIGVHPDVLDPAAQTTSVGLVLAMNIPTGMSTVNVTAPGGAKLATQNVVIRAGAVTFVSAEPAP
jgi:hypothetical protein